LIRQTKPQNINQYVPKPRQKERKRKRKKRRKEGRKEGRKEKIYMLK
jgi:hypothetical protein